MKYVPTPPPVSWLRRAVLLLLAVLVGPFLLVAVARLIEQTIAPLMPLMWVAGALVVLYGIGRLLFRSRA